MEMLRRLMVALGLSLLVASSAGAQLASQTALVGTVSDSGGLVLPGAQVVAVNLGTKDTYETTTNGEGYYNIQFVRPGSYEITFTLAGFQTFKTTGVEVATNQVVRTNATLQPGGVTETVNVEAEAQVLNTDSATVAETVGERAIRELPLNGRNVWNLAATTPGVVSAGNERHRPELPRRRPARDPEQPRRSTASTPRRTCWRRPACARSPTRSPKCRCRPAARRPSTAPISASTSTSSPRAAPTTPHGALAYYYQDDSLDARGYFENRANPKNPRKRNQFSFEVDGPLMHPGLYDGRNKTFFMAAYEGVRSEAAVAVVRDGADRADAPGRLLGSDHGDQEPVHRTELPGQHHSAVDALAGRRCSCCSTIPAPNLPGTRLEPPGDALGDRRRRSAAAARRPEPEQQDPPLRPLQLVRHLHQQRSKRCR